MAAHTTIPTLSLIGNTPMIRVTAFDTGVCELYLKLESQNPGGSIKDRMAVAMVEAAERDGSLQPGRHDGGGDGGEYGDRAGAGGGD